MAQNYGAGEKERVRKGYHVSLWTVGLWGILVSAIFICFPGAIADVFFHEPKAVEIAIGYLVIIGFGEAFMCVELTTIGALSWTWKDAPLQCDQRRVYECQDPARGHSFRIYGTSRDLVGADVYVGREGDHLYLYLFLDHEEENIIKNF